jgi:hypothetical protein
LTTIFFFPKELRAENDIIVRLKWGCGYGEVVKEQYKCQTATNEAEQLVVRMVNFSGLKYNRIIVYLSNEVATAVTGPNEDGYTTTIINSKFLGPTNEWRAKIVLAHELGHAFYKNDKTTFENEMKADDYSGFWSRKAALPDSSYLNSVIRSAPQPPDYPSYDDRVKSAYEGWKEAGKPFELKPDSAKENDHSTGITQENNANKFKRYLDLLVTVAPESYTKWFTTYNANRVKIHLISSDPHLLIDSVSNKIDHVLYIFNEKAFKNPYQPSTNPNSDNFGYSLTRVTQPFPMICVVYFKDGSAFSIIKNLHLENIKL